MVKKRPIKKQIISQLIRDTHAIVTVRGTDDDYERARKVIGEAVRKYNYLSQNKMSYEVRLVSNRHNPGEKKADLLINDQKNELEEKTKALAELEPARAKAKIPKGVPESISDGVQKAVLSAIHGTDVEVQL